MNCPEEGCGKVFTRRDNAERHCVRFHFHYLDGSPAPPDLVEKLTGRVRDSDRRRLEAKHLVTASTGVGRPRRKARRVDDRPEGRSVSVPSAVGEVGGGEDSDTDRPMRCFTPDQPDPFPPTKQECKSGRTRQPRVRPRKASPAPPENLGSPEIRKPTKPAPVLAKFRRRLSEERHFGTITPVPRPQILVMRPVALTPAADLSSMLWNFPGAPVDQVASEAALANRWSPTVAREARGRLGAMAYHERRVFDEIRRLLPPVLDANTGITFGLRVREMLDGHGNRPGPDPGD